MPRFLPGMVLAGVLLLAGCGLGQKDEPAAGEDHARQKSRHTPAFGAKSAELKPPNEAFGWVADSPGKVRHISNIGHRRIHPGIRSVSGAIPVGEAVRH